MSTSIDGKRFLIVQDAVWTYDHEKWDHGVKGIRILVTTRQRDVVDIMRATSDKDGICLLCFFPCIFVTLTFLQVDEFKAFEEISKKMVDICKGLPLTAKDLGNLMCNK
ncbi:hypothetical protein DVH24_020298 [Malus domestica]|uniref:NB-ARC domain-containing protein n=1 Tax=Malus domestica TaxID=3750 RepID=A0A498J8X6_MALDO|nr:hypothetical protein DVH24_020298 [Malus domestica]